MSLPKNSRSFTFNWFLLVLIVLVLTLNFLATSFSCPPSARTLRIAWHLSLRLGMNDSQSSFLAAFVDGSSCSLLNTSVKRILETVIVKFGGGPVGVSSLAVAVGEEPDTIEEVYEPYLIMEGYLQRTPQGRVATELSYKKLGLKPNTGRQTNLL